MQASHDLSDIIPAQAAFPVLHIGYDFVRLLTHKSHVQVRFVTVSFADVLVETTADTVRKATQAQRMGLRSSRVSTGYRLQCIVRDTSNSRNHAHAGRHVCHSTTEARLGSDEAGSWGRGQRLAGQSEQSKQASVYRLYSKNTVNYVICHRTAVDVKQ